uniref:THO complex subunit 1-like isoform X1 n=1 Tax=Styela clava TaxID=7725 RepID=UPI00193A8D02|nr:THO complex subunit 1-like isoform X1 [Styela clava]
MASDFVFQDALSSFKNEIFEDLSSGKIDSIVSITSVFQTISGTEADKRLAADQAFRITVSNLIQETIKEIHGDKEMANDALKVISLTVVAAKQGMCSASLPFSLLGDLLDCLTLDTCDPVFCFIEERVATWKSSQFYTAGKNFLLRMCNDLLRRLSQAQNTVFCGRIQLFLARLFPLSEKSALNLFSQFNSDNVTIYNANAAESILKIKSEESSDEVSDEKPVVVDVKPQKDEIWLDGNLEGMEVDQPESSVAPSVSDDIKQEQVKHDKGLIVDYELYSSIWSLQDFFRSPTQCYIQDSWDKFIKNAESVFRVFNSFKLDKHNFTERQMDKAYFAKFLTSEKLTNLQLNDGMFRRQLLCQFLILFQYLTGTVKFKSANAVLNEKQNEWIKKTKEKIYSLLEETPPDGKHFASYIKHLLSREEFWIQWKNEGCTSFIKNKKETKETEIKQSQSPPAKRRKTGDSNTTQKPKRSTIAEDFIAGKPLGMGSAELTRLWELCPDNLTACKSEKRSFLPTLEGFFANGIELMDPKNMVEEEYMPYNDPNFQWRALRLLSQRSPLFFASQPATMQFKVVPQYLKGIMKKLSEEFPQQVPDQPEMIQENGEVDKSLDEEDVDEDQNIQDDDKMQQDKEDELDEDQEEDDDDDEVLEDEEFDNNDDDALLDDSQQEDADSEDEGLLEPTAPGDTLSSDQVTTVAQKIGKDWEKLAPYLKLEPKDIAEIKEDSEDVILQARQTLVTWQDRNRSEARKPALLQALVKANMEHLAKEIS